MFLALVSNAVFLIVSRSRSGLALRSFPASDLAISRIAVVTAVAAVAAVAVSAIPHRAKVSRALQRNSR